MGTTSNRAKQTVTVQCGRFIEHWMGGWPEVPVKVLESACNGWPTSHWPLWERLALCYSWKGIEQRIYASRVVPLRCMWKAKVIRKYALKVVAKQEPTNSFGSRPKLCKLSEKHIVRQIIFYVIGYDRVRKYVYRPSSCSYWTREGGNAKARMLNKLTILSAKFQQSHLKLVLE